MILFFSKIFFFTVNEFHNRSDAIEDDSDYWHRRYSTIVAVDRSNSIEIVMDSLNFAVAVVEHSMDHQVDYSPVEK